MAVPYTFATATSAIPLSQLDSNFSTTITLGNTAIQLGNTVTTLNNMTLANVTISSGGSFTSNSISTSGNLTFTGTGNRILGDFSNATVANRVMLQNSVTNSASRLGLLPNGTSTSASWDAFNNNDPTNASLARYGVTSTDSRFESTVTGTGTLLPMTFYTGGSERMRIVGGTGSDVGYIGIGTASPIVPIDVYNATSSSIRLQGDSATQVQLSRFSTDTSPATYLIKKARGTVASPAAVASGDTMGSIIFQAYGGTNNRNLAAISSGVSTYTSDTDISSFINFSTTPTGSVTAAERMRIDSAGNVGIGINAPSYNLHVKNASGNSYIASQYGTATIGLITAAANQVDIKAFNGTNDVMTFTTGASERMRIDSSGNVGIGTSAPGALLDVVANSGNVNIRVRNNNGIGDFYTLSNGDNFLTAQSAGKSLIFGTVGAERMRIDSIGNLLVGTTSSTNSAKVTAVSSSLSASYQMMMNNTDTGTGNQISMDIYRNSTRVGYITTTNTTTSFTSISDYRLKKDVVPMTNALAAVAQLKPCRYKWKVDGSDGQGFIAHELQAVVPDCVFGEKDAVNEDGSIKPQGIDTSFLVATLTAAIQELKAEVDALKGAK